MIDHNGFTIKCAVPECTGTFDAFVQTERTAIDHARLAHWAVVHVRVTKGARSRDVRTVRRCFCPIHKHLVGV